MYKRQDVSTVHIDLFYHDFITFNNIITFLTLSLIHILGNAGSKPADVMVITAEYENIGLSRMMVQLSVKRVRVNPDAVVEFNNTISIGQTTNREVRTSVMTDGLESIGNVATLPGT